jgi:16S rRNA (guanine527-N7)-methyltransferase
VDKKEARLVLERALGAEVSTVAVHRFEVFASELNRFGSKLNLTTIRSPTDVFDKHFADSLLVSSSISSGRLLDVGAGAGFPGVPLAIVRDDLDVTLVEASKKKIGFLKSLLATLDLPNAHVFHLRLTNDSALGLFDTVIARALMDLSRWLDLAKRHVVPAGKIVAMLADTPTTAVLESTAADTSVRLISVSKKRLPISGDPRTIAVFQATSRPD